MAESPSHKFGQIIGNLIESIMKPPLEDFCREFGLYLDYQGKERAARSGKKVTWSDKYGNLHDLDYVIERGGSDSDIGQPVAFIEVAWRRYTKYSRNKAQEIQGAVRPLAEKYRWNNPFLGAVLSGVFTSGSIEQLTSLGFHVLYFPYETIVDAFSQEGINIQFDEDMPDSEFQNCVSLLEQAPPSLFESVKQSLVQTNESALQDFLTALGTRLSRLVERIVIIPLYGKVNEFSTVESALSFLNEHPISESSQTFRKYEVIVSFSNGDDVKGSFPSKQKAKDFIQFVTSQ
jgi:hypothetical protein